MTHPYTNEDIARTFDNLASLLELQGENPFKIRAYQRVVRVIEHLPRPLAQLVAEGEDLRQVPGVGEAISSKIVELLTTGSMKAYEEAKAHFPPGVLTLMDVPGIGPKTAVRIVQELGVSTVEELEQAIVEGNLAALPRMGEKSAENILRHLRSLGAKERRIPLGKALSIAEEVIAALREACPDIGQMEPAGSLRRWKETIGDVDIMGAARDPAQVLDALVHLPHVREVLAHGPKKASVLTHSGVQIDLRLVDESQYGALIQYFTGSKEHNVHLREYARRMGLSLNEYGITPDGGEMETFATEDAFYARLGLQPIPPELREGIMEVEMAHRRALPHLVNPGDIEGDLHVHTVWSDGHDSSEAMLRAARQRGYQYVAITDHSVGRGIANGLTEERLHEHIRELRNLEDRVGIRVLVGSEVDIRADGSLDYPDDVLAELDVVVAAVHSAMGQDQERMTQRIIKAMRHPSVHVIAHLTTRLIGQRDPVDVDVEAVLRAAAETGTALEINSSPERLDLKDTHAMRARELAVPLVISTDSHDVASLGQMRYGVAVARRAWCEAKDVLNTRPLDEVLAVLHRKRLQADSAFRR